MEKRKPEWCGRHFFAGVVSLPVLMVTADGPLASLLRPVGGFMEPFLGMLAEAGGLKTLLISAGIFSILPMLAYFAVASTVWARLCGWLGAASGFVFVSVAFSAALNNIVKFLAGRARPPFAESLNRPDFHPFTASDDFHSFPSGHANAFFAIALSVGFVAPPLRRWLLIVATGLALCRVLQFQHFVSDTAGGALLAVATTYWLRGCFAHHGVVFRAGRGGRITVNATGRLLARSIKRCVRCKPMNTGAAIKRQPGK